MPDNRRRLHLYSDPSKSTSGSTLHQIQNGQAGLIVYASKRKPTTAQNYSVTKLELYGLAIDFASFFSPVKRVDFDTVVENLALTHIMKSKSELATNKIKRLLQMFNPYTFSLYYLKDKKYAQGCHNELGCLGYDRALDLIRDRFYLTNMALDIQAFIQQCEHCLRFKAKLTKEPFHLTVTTYSL